MGDEGVEWHDQLLEIVHHVRQFDSECDVAPDVIDFIDSLRAEVARLQGSIRDEAIQLNDEMSKKCGEYWAENIALRDRVARLEKELADLKAEPDWHAFYTDSQTNYYAAQEKIARLEKERDALKDALKQRSATTAREHAELREVINSEIGAAEARIRALEEK